jgi:hypothetical protein
MRSIIGARTVLSRSLARHAAANAAHPHNFLTNTTRALTGEMRPKKRGVLGTLGMVHLQAMVRQA